MSWKESKVRLLTPPLALNPQDRKPDIQDLFLLASQATAYRNTPPVGSISSSDQSVTLPLHPIKVEQSQVINDVTSADSAMMPPPPVPPPRPPASPGVSSTTSSGSDPDQCHNLNQGVNQPLLGKIPKGRIS